MEPRRRRTRTVSAIIIVTTIVAVALRLYELSRPGYFLGVSEYDDGTDFGSAIRLVHGGLPYRDFIMVQPPGITLLMAPVALAAKGASTAAAMAAGRVLTALAGAAAVPVAGLLTRHRGPLAVLITGGILAVYPDSLMAARTVLLEPWLVLFCLLGALAVFDGDQFAGTRRLVLGGLAFGFAGAVKVWAILPVLVIVVLLTRRPRRLAAYLGGVVAGFAVPVLPLALTAPATFYRGVVVAQVLRSDVVRVPVAFRLQHLLGLTHSPQFPTLALALICVAVAAIVAGLMMAASRLGQRPTPALDWWAVVTGLLSVAAFLWPADFYYHYAAFFAPFLALALALPLARLTAVLPADVKPERALLARWTVTAIAVVTLATLAGLQASAEGNQSSAVTGSELARAQRLIPPGACVVTDQVSYTIAINRFVSASPRCSLMVDGVGTDYTLSGGHNGVTGAGREPAVQHVWLSAFRAAQFVYLTGEAPRRIPWTPALLAYFHAHFTPLIRGPNWLYRRTS